MIKPYAIAIALALTFSSPVFAQLEPLERLPQSGQVRGALTGEKTYLFSAQQGQQIRLDIWAGFLTVEIYRPNGQRLTSLTSGQWSGNAPESGEYRLKLTTAQQTNYALRVAVSTPQPQQPTQPSTLQPVEFQPSTRNPNIPIMVLRESTNNFRLISPSPDPAKPAYDGRLTLADVHLAKMYEVTQFFCEGNPEIGPLNWQYESAGRIRKITISCNAAADIVNQFGLWEGERSERTRIYGRSIADYTIPVLAISGEDEITQWIRFRFRF